MSSPKHIFHVCTISNDSISLCRFIASVLAHASFSSFVYFLTPASFKPWSITEPTLKFKWVSEWVSEWVRRRMNKWVSERVTEWVNYTRLFKQHYFQFIFLSNSLEFWGLRLKLSRGISYPICVIVKKLSDSCISGWRGRFSWLTWPSSLLLEVGFFSRTEFHLVHVVM